MTSESMIKRNGLNKICWVVELAEDGTVTYSQPHIIGSDDSKAISLKGLNFFDEFTLLNDTARCRQNFQSFVHARKAVDSFVWHCSSNSGTVPVKVSMTRTYQSGQDLSATGVMMELRECL
jgi:hypothetical protein